MPGMLARSFKPSTQEVEVMAFCEFRVSLVVYTVSSRPARDTQTLSRKKLEKIVRKRNPDWTKTSNRITYPGYTTIITKID